MHFDGVVHHQLCNLTPFYVISKCVQSTEWQLCVAHKAEQHLIMYIPRDGCPLLTCHHYLPLLAVKIDKESRKVVEDVIDEDEVPAVCLLVFLLIHCTHVLCTCYDAQTCFAVVCHSMII